jgi:hypothetical protein
MTTSFYRYVAVGALALGLSSGATCARESGMMGYWNRSGHSVSHQWYPGLYAPSYTPDAPAQFGAKSDPAPEPTDAEVAKALHDERVCAPVKVYLESGVAYHPASGCRK